MIPPMRKPQPSPDRLPPHSPEAEQGVLGCILMSPIECLDQCAEKLKSGRLAFYDLRHQTIYDELVRMHDQLDPIDIITLQQKLKDRNLLEQIGGIPYLNALQEAVPSAANFSYYLDIIEEKALLRRMVHVCTDLVGRIYDYEGEVDVLLDEVERGVLSFKSSKTKPTLDANMAGERMITDLERRHALNGKLSGLDTGFSKLNYMTEGLQYGEQFIIGARPAQGKTALGLTILAHAGFNGVPCLFVSLEMSIEAVMRRLCSMKTRIPLQSIRKGTYDESMFGKFSSFRVQLKKAPIFFADGVDGYGIREIASRVNRMVLKHGIKLVVIDYLQKIKPSEKQEKRTYEVAEVSGRLKALAYDNNVAMITLAQLNRENVKGEKKEARAPRLSDLADSGQIERDADMVGLIHREGNLAKLIIAKQRDGEVGSVPLYFDATYAQFVSMDD